MGVVKKGARTILDVEMQRRWLAGAGPDKWGDFGAGAGREKWKLMDRQIWADFLPQTSTSNR